MDFRRRQFKPASALLRALFVLVGLCLATASWAASNFRVERLGVDDGLSQAQVTDIVQDRHGYLWIGTQEGLNRFDGQQVKHYFHTRGDSKTIPEDWITSLLLTDHGTLLAATNESGIARYDFATDSFTKLDLFNGAKRRYKVRARSMLQSRQGDVWIGTIDGGLYVYNPANQQTLRYKKAVNLGLNLRKHAIIALAEDQQGLLWIGMDGGGVINFNPADQTFNQLVLPEPELDWSKARILSLKADSQNRLWIGTEGAGLIMLGADRKTTRHYHSQAKSPQRLLGSNLVRDVLEDQSGHIWVATDAGLNQLKADNSIQTYKHNASDPQSLSENRTRSLYQDSARSLWIGTYSGLNKWNYVSDAFSYWDETQLDSSLVTALATTPEGHTWVGTYGAGLALMSSSGKRLQSLRHQPHDPYSLQDDRVMALHIDATGRLWVGTRSAGLHRLNDDGVSFQQYTASAEPGALSNNGVTAITSDRFGSIWVGTYNGGLNKFSEGDFEVFRHDPNDPVSIGDDRVIFLTTDSQGLVWVGTEGGGFASLDPASEHIITYQASNKPNSLTTDAAWLLLEASDGALWIGTQGGGLYRWQTAHRAAGIARFDRFTKQNGLASDTILGLAEDRTGNIWISSNMGITQIDPATLLTRSFDASSGLRDNEFHHGVMSHRNGLIRFGGPAGLLTFDPADLAKNQHAPEVVITAKVAGQPDVYSHSDQPAKQVELRYPANHLAFDFVGLDYVSPSKNQYRYRLVGFDTDWVDPQRYLHAIYTNLEPGEYRFEVAASNNDGVWNNRGAAVAVNVIPPPWLSPTAKSLYVLTLLLLAAAFIRSQKKKMQDVRMYQDKLESQVHDRTQELYHRNNELKLLNDKLKEASLSDPLTGLHNRRYFYEVIESEIAHIARANHNPENGQPTSSLFFMMIDLDGFKAVNDTLGHKAGDDVLIQLAGILNDTVRQADTVIRWGGDEFLVFGRVTHTHDVELLAERIRQRTVEFNFQPEPDAIALSTSIGVAWYPQSIKDRGSLSWEKVLEIADQGAYIAKSSGKNAWVTIDLHNVDASHITQDIEVTELLKRRAGVQMISSRTITVQQL